MVRRKSQLEGVEANVEGKESVLGNPHQSDVP